MEKNEDGLNRIEWYLLGFDFDAWQILIIFIWCWLWFEMKFKNFEQLIVVFHSSLMLKKHFDYFLKYLRKRWGICKLSEYCLFSWNDDRWNRTLLNFRLELQIFTEIRDLFYQMMKIHSRFSLIPKDNIKSSICRSYVSYTVQKIIELSNRSKFSDLIVHY